MKNKILVLIITAALGISIVGIVNAHGRDYDDDHGMMRGGHMGMMRGYDRYDKDDCPRWGSDRERTNREIDANEAKKIAKLLLEEKLIACATFVNAESMYKWEDKIVDDVETIAFMKSSEENWNKIRSKITDWARDEE